MFHFSRQLGAEFCIELFDAGNVSFPQVSIHIEQAFNGVDGDILQTFNVDILGDVYKRQRPYIWKDYQVQDGTY